MAIPFAYNLRNLVVRKTTTLMTALGIALTVAVLLAVLALVEGLRTSLDATGRPAARAGDAQGLGLGTGQQLHRAASYQDLKFKPGIARGTRRASRWRRSKWSP